MDEDEDPLDDIVLVVGEDVLDKAEACTVLVLPVFAIDICVLELVTA